MMARAKRIYILIVKVNKLFPFFSLRCFLKEIENMFSVFLLSYRNTRESLGELEEAVETLACGSSSHSISRSPKLPLVFLQFDRNTVHVFYFLIKTIFIHRNNHSKIHDIAPLTKSPSFIRLSFKSTVSHHSENIAIGSICQFILSSRNPAVMFILHCPTLKSQEKCPFFHLK